MIIFLILQIIAFSVPPLYFTTLSTLSRRTHYYVYISLLLLFGGFLGNIYSIPIFNGITVSGGSLCYGAFMMTAVMFVWTERDAFILRHLVRLVILVDIFKIVFSLLIGSLLQVDGVINRYNVPPDLFDFSIILIILGGILIITELLILLIIFEFTKKKTLPIKMVASIYILSFILVLVLDGIAFPFIAFGMTAPIAAMVFGGIGGKVIIAAAFSTALAFFMLWRRREFSNYLDSDTVRWRLLIASSADLIRDMESKDQDIQRGDIVFRNSAEGLAIVDHAGRILKSNSAFQKMLGLTSPEKQKSPLNLDQIFYNDIGPIALLRSPAEGWRSEVLFGPERRTPGVLAITPAGVDADGGQSFVYSLTDIADQKTIQKRLEHLAAHDPLTELPNRRKLDECLAALGPNTSAALMVVDIDHFKDVNDSYGHVTGDMVLKETASRLQGIKNNKLQEKDIVCRIGGDEFAVLIHSSDENFIYETIGDIQKALEQTIKIGENLEILSSTTIGLSCHEQLQDHDLLLEADAALYEAKRNRRGSIGVYEERLTSESQKKLIIGLRLKNAIANGDIDVHYQPQFDTLNHQIRGVEALARWTDPMLGPVSPAVFIPIAEATGLIEPLGEYVMERACRDGRDWIAQGHAPVTLSVNISASQLRYGRFMPALRKILAETDFPANRLEIEVTESSYIEREGEVTPILRELMAMGINIVIDDFGTGYSSLSYLRDMEWSCLKIDRSFVTGIPSDAKQCSLAMAIIRLAKVMSFKVVAEGVETREQLEFLTAQDCDLIQGYYFSKPLPKDELTSLFVQKTA